MATPDKNRLQKLIVFPTETVYGLGASAFDPDAISAVFEVKGRPSDNPLIVHVADKNMVNDFAIEISDDAEKLMDVFWPGPLTLVLPKKPEVLDSITSGLNTVAVRMPNHPLAQKALLERGAMVAPSANRSGRPSPTSPEHVLADFGDSLSVIDGGKCELGLESTVINLAEEPYTILRPGHISASDIESILQKKVIRSTDSIQEGPARSPGMKYSHYAPKARVCWFNPTSDALQSDTLYLMLNSVEHFHGENVINYTNDLKKLAAELYDRFRQADIQGFDFIVIEKPTSKDGLSLALINRIEKASGE